MATNLDMSHIKQRFAHLRPQSATDGLAAPIHVRLQPARRLTWYRLYMKRFGGNRRTTYLLTPMTRSHGLILICENGLTRDMIGDQPIAGTITRQQNIPSAAGTGRVTQTCTITVTEILPSAPADLPLVVTFLEQSALQSWMLPLFGADPRVLNQGRSL